MIWNLPLKESFICCKTRNGKRTAAALKIACDLVVEGMITEEQAVLSIIQNSLMHYYIRNLILH